MKILGIDPALTKLGWAMINIHNSKIHYLASGLIKTKSEELMHHRLGFISSNIKKLINCHQPDAISMEITFVNKNPTSSLKLAYVRGAIMALVSETGIAYFEYSANQIKKTLVGSGHADKDQIKTMAQLIISGTPSNITSDEADALAAAYTRFANL